MSFKTATALLRGAFLIEPKYAQAQLPIVLRMLQGNYEEPSSNIETSAHNVPRRVQMQNTSSAVYTIRPYQSTDRLPYNSIAMVDIIGPILKYGDWCTEGSISYNDLMLRLAASDRVQGIILNIDSPGGQAAGTAMLYETIREITKVKPVISIIQDGYAASAGMWIAAGAQEIYCTRGTDSVGSIGAYVTLYDFTEYFAAEGIKITEIYAPQSVDKNKNYKDAIAGDTAGVENELAFLVEDFKAGIANSRGARLKMKGNEPFTGKMYFAKEAKAIGLIDGIKSLSGVVDRMNQLIKLRK
ncbi:MAG: S49 family peptidase [Ferruginibacter sp.]|nr:S49 family peptidase [Ferruginibacter sp.]